MPYNDFKNVERLCSDYLGPGSWEILFSDEKEAVKAFLDESSNEQLRDTVLEIDELLRDGNEIKFHDLLIRGFRLSYWTPSEYGSFAHWLETVRERAANEINESNKPPDQSGRERPKNTRGATGNTSSDRLRRPESGSQRKPVWQWAALTLACIVLVFGLNWAREQINGAEPNPWPLIGIFVGAFLLVAYLPKVSTRVKKTVIFTTLFALFVIACYRGIFQAANQALGGVMHQIGSDKPSSSAPEPSHSSNRVTVPQGTRPKASLASTVTVERSCAERGFEGNWQWKMIDIKPGDPEHILTSKGILLPGSRIQICADAETPQDLHKLLVWVGAEPNASSASTWRPDSKNQKVWYVDKRIQFGFKADADPGGYLHFLADGELKKNVRVYVWIGA